MKELRLLSLAYLLLPVLSGYLSQTRSEDSISNRAAANSIKAQVLHATAKRSDFHNRHGKVKKSKRKTMVEKRSPVQKRQFVPFSIFHSHPHFHRIIVHHHPEHSFCEPTPCQNGGTCTVIARGYECTCSPGFMGTHCELRSQCEPSPCKNGGTCYDVGLGYECTCAKGFRGENCEELNKCYPNPCRNGGTCTGTNDVEGYECTCRVGFKGKDCEEINLCLPSPCKNGGTCSERTGGRFECTCPIGYKGITCEERSICLSNPCLNGGTCLDETYGYRCSCRLGYTGNNCQHHVCKPNPCQNDGRCLDEGGIGRCVCQVGFHGDHCEMTSSCTSHPCLHDGTCVDTYFLHRTHPMDSFDLSTSTAFDGYHDRPYVCKCVQPYSGQNCEDDRCRFCSPHAECILSHCICNEGFHGDGKTCTKNVCHPNPCSNAGLCIPTESSFDCECKLGWTGPLCETRQFCTPNPCKNGGTCIPEQDGYKCICSSQYEGNNCEKSNPCSTNPCKNGGTCKEMNGVPVCECPQQFEGNMCESDKCAKCDKNARCENGKCLCNEGYVGDGETCTGGDILPVGKASPCSSNPCLHGECIDQGDSYACSCDEGWSGANCEQSVGLGNPCDPDPCENKGQCLVQGGEAKCICPEGFEGDRCEIPKDGGDGGGVLPASVCHPNPCNNGGVCHANGGGYDCMCPPQYSGPNCEVDECEKCDINALCINGRCKCKHGYFGNGYECEKEEEENDCTRCSPFARCLKGVCICLDQYTGNGYTCQPQQPTTCNNCPPPNSCAPSGICIPFVHKKSDISKTAMAIPHKDDE